MLDEMRKSSQQQSNTDNLGTISRISQCNTFFFYLILSSIELIHHLSKNGIYETLHQYPLLTIKQWSIRFNTINEGSKGTLASEKRSINSILDDSLLNWSPNQYNFHRYGIIIRIQDIQHPNYNL